jgi:hypothetical protein
MILSVAITTRAGRALVSRQFNRLTRTQVEGHLGAFPKLLSRANQSYVETENIRYVYQDLGDLYFIVITTKDSNILEDLDLLSLLLDLTRQTLETQETEVNEQLVLDSSLELIFAYDECIFDGYRQNVTVSDVKTFLKMESQEEDEFNRERKAKEDKAREELRAKMQEIRRQKRAAARSRDTAPQPIAVTSVVEAVEDVERPKPIRRQAAGQAGMALQKRGSPRDRAEQMILEEGLTARDRPIPKAADVSAAFAGVSVKLVEIMNAGLTMDGRVEHMELEGRLIADSSARGTFFIQLGKEANFGRFKTRHMKQKDRKLFPDKKQLQFDSTEPGETTLLGWRFTSVGGKDLPMSVNCWIPDPKERSTSFGCEVELNDQTLVFAPVVLAVPVRKPRAAQVSRADGEIEVVEKEGLLKWSIPELSAENQTAELEFVVPPSDSSFSPITVEFESETLFSGFEVVSVAAAQSDGQPNFEEPVRYQVTKSLTAGQFQIT